VYVNLADAAILNPEKANDVMHNILANSRLNVLKAYAVKTLA
jgi:hypothetical protein